MPAPKASGEQKGGCDQCLGPILKESQLLPGTSTHRWPLSRRHTWAGSRVLQFLISYSCRPKHVGISPKDTSPGHRVRSFPTFEGLNGKTSQSQVSELNFLCVFDTLQQKSRRRKRNKEPASLVLSPVPQRAHSFLPSHQSWERSEYCDYDILHWVHFPF